MQDAARGVMSDWFRAGSQNRQGVLQGLDWHSEAQLVPGADGNQF